MSLSEILTEVVEVMKRTKESWVAESPDQPDLAIYEHYYRGGDLVATVQCPMDRDIALRAAMVACPGFSADVVSVTFESYSTKHTKSPVTGEEWMPKEMQFVAQTMPEAFEKGWVHECLTTSIHERGGDYALASHGYRITDGVVEWLEAKSMNPEHENPTSGGGFMFDNLQAAMERKTMEETVREETENENEPLLQLLAGTFKDDPERRAFHIDMATSRVLEDNELAIGVMLMAEAGTNRAEWLEERLGDPSDIITNE